MPGIDSSRRLQFDDVANAQTILADTSKSVFGRTKLDAIETFVPHQVIYTCRNASNEIKDNKLKGAMEKYLNEIEVIGKNEKTAFKDYSSQTIKVYKIIVKTLDGYIQEVDQRIKQKKISPYCGEYIIRVLKLLKESNTMLIKFISKIKDSSKEISEEIRTKITKLSGYASELAVFLTNKDLIRGKKEFGEDTAKILDKLMNSLKQLILSLKRSLGEKPATKSLSPEAEVILRGFPG